MSTSNIPDRRRPRRRPATATAAVPRKQIERTRAVRVPPGRIGRWSARHPRLALSIWGAFAVGCVAAGAAAGTSTPSHGLAGEPARGNAVVNQPGLAPTREYAGGQIASGVDAGARR